MARPRRFSAARALNLILDMANADEEAIAPNNDDEVYNEQVENGEQLLDNSTDGVELEEDSSDGDIDLFSEQDSDSDEDNEEEFESAGIKYSERPFEHRRRQRNVIDFHPRASVNPQSELEAFQLFMSDDILLQIQRYTNRKVIELRRVVPKTYGFMSTFSLDEVKACIGIILYAGSDHDNFTEVTDLWDPIEGKPLYKATMSINRFQFFLRAIRFDNFRSRSQRLDQCRLAAVSDIWQLFNESLRKFYVPAEVLTVDEQLLGYRGQIPGRTYLPSKPRKYGIKIFWICEAESGYALNAEVYTGRGQNQPVHRGLAKDVVMKLCEPFHHSGREIVTDNFFTSHALAVALLEKNLTLLGTLRLCRVEIPNVLRDKSRPVESTKFLYDHDNKIVLASYIPKRNKNVVLLSSSHAGNTVFPNHANKPEMILDYNIGKKGVDQFDQNIEKFTCRRKTVRWPVLFFYNIIDVAAFNAFLVLKKNGYGRPRKQFLNALSRQLVFSCARSRVLRNSNLRKPAKEAARLLGFLPENQNQGESKKY